MRKKISFYLLLVFLLSVHLLTGCKKDAETIAGHTISMTAKLDGQSWSTNEVNANYNSGFLKIFGYNPLLGTITLTIDGVDQYTTSSGTSTSIKYLIIEIVAYSTYDPIPRIGIRDLNVNYPDSILPQFNGISVPFLFIVSLSVLALATYRQIRKMEEKIKL